MKLTLDHDPITKTRRTFHADGGADEFHIETVEDVTDVVGTAKAQYNDRGGTRFGNRAHVAFIPPVVWGQLIRKGIAFNQERLRAWLNDSDNRAWRTRPGRV